VATVRIAGAVLLFAACAASAPRPTGPVAPAGELAPTSAGLEVVPRSELVVESGRIDVAPPGAGLELVSPVVRALVGDRPRDGLELAFVYRGPTAEARPLASGELRRQIGLKLRARDTCNVVYVMWHLSPTQGIHVSVKSNPGAHVHAECGDRGYVQVSPQRHGAAPAIRVGEVHRLRASIDGVRLRVTVDGSLAWEGPLPPEALAVDGPVGIRSDNGLFSATIAVRR
jgi:hypothetical protein